MVSILILNIWYAFGELAWEPRLAYLARLDAENNFIEKRRAIPQQIYNIFVCASPQLNLKKGTRFPFLFNTQRQHLEQSNKESYNIFL